MPSGLPLAGGDIESLLARRFEKRHRDRIHRLYRHDAAVMALLYNIAVVVDDAEEIGILQNHRAVEVSSASNTRSRSLWPCETAISTNSMERLAVYE